MKILLKYIMELNYLKGYIKLVYIQIDKLQPLNIYVLIYKDITLSSRHINTKYVVYNTINPSRAL